MDQSQFDAVTRTFARFPSRRAVLRGLAGTGLGLNTLRLADSGEARKKRKHKKRKPKAKPNAFGCFNVGAACNSVDQCCSGICTGKKCRAHDVGTCDQARPGYCAEGNPNDASCNGGTGACFRTTGSSNVCINNFFCADCQRDVDCEALGYPAGAVCVPVTGNFACADLCAEEQVRMACGYYSDATSLAAEH